MCLHQALEVNRTRLLGGSGGPYRHWRAHIDTRRKQVLLFPGYRFVNSHTHILTHSHIHTSLQIPRVPFR